jgi:predicted ATPase/DNA-binding CsgD family transcriptional regulator
MIARFAREAKALLVLNHPNIVKVLATIEIEEENKIYVIMEFAEAGSLRHWLDREGRLSLISALEITIDLADALTRAHRLKIIHRDLKPANVLMTSDSTARLSDFGTAKLGDAYLGEGPRLTQAGMIVGTIDYLSPEACQGAELDARTDIWALGVMLFEMLAGIRPFSKTTVAATLSAILTQPIPDLEMLLPDAPAALVDLINRMLEKDREGRIPSMRLVGAELEAILEDTAGGTSQTSTPVNVARRFSTPTPTPSGAPRHNLPVEATPFVGREAELTELARLFADPNTRLITIVGPGGMGKTRLAVEAAAAQLPNFEHGVFFVPLAPLASTANISSAIADAIGIQFYETNTPEKQLLDYFRQRRLLLVMDNFEHLVGNANVLDGTRLLSEILRLAPNVNVLATSREKLNLQIETRYRLAGMDFPHWQSADQAALKDAREYSAIRLFMQSARRALPSFDLKADNLGHIARICSLVEGVPLGILLAAAWVEMFSPKDIAYEISQNLDFLATELRDVPDRHRSLRAVFDSSWKQLPEAEHEVLRKLSVFRDGFGREAALAVAGASLRMLLSLVNKSFLQRDPNSGRYQMHELLRQYFEERLEEAGKKDSTRDAACAFYAEFMGERLASMLSRKQEKALDDIDAEFENVRRAWLRAVEQKDYSAIDRASESLFVFSDMRSREYEGEELFCTARKELGPQPGEEPHSVWIRLLLPWFDLLLQSKGRPEDIEGIREQAESNLAFARKRDDTLGIAYGLIMLGHFAEPGEALDNYEKALTLCPRLDDSFWVRIRIGYAHRAKGEYRKAIQAFQQSFERGRKIGEKEKMGWSLFNTGETEIFIGDHSRAEDRWRQANRLFRQVGTSMGVVWTNINLSLMALLKGEFGEARSLFDEAQEIAINANHPVAGTQRALVLLGFLALVEDDFQKAQSCFEQALSPPAPSVEAALGLAFAASVQGDYSHAKRRLRQALHSSSPYSTPAMASLILPAAALILASVDETERGVEFLALSTQLPASPKGLLEKWPILMRFRDEVEATLSPEVFASTWERGLALDAEAVVTSLRDELFVDLPSPDKVTTLLTRARQPLIEPLSDRELEVLELIAIGRTNREIAEKLVVALGTVKAHTSAIYRKLDVRSRTQAVAKARELELL